jgi:GT2 family glycosyltransferase
MNIAVLVLTWNATDVALACLHALAQQERPPAYTLVVDNGSVDETVAQIRAAFPQLHLVQNRTNLGFAQGMNVGLTTLRQIGKPPDVVVLLNQDTVVAPDWLAALFAPFTADPHLGAAGCKIRYPDGTLQHAGMTLEWPRAVVHHIGTHEPDTGQYDEMQPYDAVTGAALALRMSALDKVGLFDPGYSPAYYEDADLCWRLRHSGYQVAYVPAAVLTHHESLSLRNPLTRSQYYNRGRLRYVLKTYAAADIVGPFADAEQAFIREHLHPAEARALRWAYIETLLHLPDILKTRAALHPPLAPEMRQQIEAALTACKQTLTDTLTQRAQRGIDELVIYAEADSVFPDTDETDEANELTAASAATEPDNA